MMGDKRRARSSRRVGRSWGARFVCEHLERRRLLATYVVTNSGDQAGAGSLRWAVNQVNADTTPDIIQFAIGLGGLQTIALSSPLPALTNTVTIDGSTQHAMEPGPAIVIDGSALASGSNGLVVEGAGSVVRGLALVGFSGSGLVLEDGGGDLVEGNDLGVLPSGTVKGNGTGLTVMSSSNTIGGSASGAGNLLSGNASFGLVITSGTLVASNNLVYGNDIGTASGGLTALGNTLGGVVVSGGGDNQIGLAGVGNVISGNQGPGITIEGGASGTFVQGNLVGVGSDGTSALGNLGDGVLIDGATGTQLGGTETGQGNIISANQSNGIETQGDTAGLLVMGNDIGTDATGLMSLGNRLNGITLGSSMDTIGGTVAGAGNTIDFNGSGSSGAGIQLVGNVVHDTFLSNSIFDNAGLGINLGSGPTSNHPAGTPGPNDYQNFPVLNLARSDGGVTTVSGVFTAAPSTVYLLQFFSSPTEDPTGFGQGKTLIGSLNVTTDSSGAASFSVPGTGTNPGSYLSATATSPSGDTSEFCMDIQTQGEIDLRLSASAAPNPTPAGGNATFTLTVNNQGSEAAHLVVLSATPPGDGTVVSVTSSQGFVLPASGGVLTAELGTIAAGASATVTIVFQTAATDTGPLTTSASVSSLETDPYPADESAGATVQVAAESDLATTLSAAPDPVPILGDTTFTVTVTNAGPSAAPTATASLPLPAGFTFVSAASSMGTTSFAGGTATAALGDLAVNGRATFTVVAQATQLGPIALTAVAASANLDPNPANNSASTTVTVDPSADLSVTTTASAPRVVTGGDLRYQVTVVNNGPDPAQGVVLTDMLPGSTLLVSTASSVNVTPTASNGVVSMTLDSLASGATAVLTIEVQTTGSPQQTITDTATASSQTLDPNPGDESSSVTTQIVGQSDLGLSATAAPGTVLVGQDVTYTLNATNTGPFDEPSALVFAQLPADVTLVSASTSQGSTPTLGADGLLSANLGALAAGGGAVVTLVLAPGPAEVGTFPIDFQIAGQNIDPNPANNTAATSIQVAASAALAVAIPPPATPAYDQVPFTYDLVVSNSGPCPATGVLVSAPLPAGTRFVSATSAGGSPVLVGNAITETIATMPPGGSTTIAVTIEPLSAGSLALATSASAEQVNPNPSAAASSRTIPVAPAVDLVVSLAAQPSSALTGRPITFVATLSNQGPDLATNVALGLPVPAGFTYAASAVSMGSSTSQSNQIIANLGDLASGATATMTVVLTAIKGGTVSVTADATSSEYQVNPTSAQATATATAIESPGVLTFSTGHVAVLETAGQAILTVNRVDGTQGAVSVPYSTVDLSATPGLDYIPVTGTLNFAPGQTTATIAVPVLANPWDNHDEWLSVALGSPTAGAVLGAYSTSQIQIIDVDPNTTPPQVAGLTWTGDARAIWSLMVRFTAPLDPTFASLAANYVLTTASGHVIPVSPSYDSATWTVSLVPAIVLPSGQAYTLRVVGTGPTAIRDIAGNILAGQAPNVPGLDYQATFEQGSKISYLDASRNRVFLKLKGPGYLEQVRTTAGVGEVLTVMGMAPRRTVLMGHVQKLKGGTGRTDIGVLNGIGQFGQMQVNLDSPPFLARVFPFMKRGRGVF